MSDMLSLTKDRVKKTLNDIRGLPLLSSLTGGELVGVSDPADNGKIKSVTTQNIANLSQSGVSFVSSTALPGSATTHDFSSVFEADKSYVVELENVEIGDGADLRMRLEISSSFITTSSYPYALTIRLEGGSFTEAVSTNEAFALLASGIGSTGAGESLSGEIKFFTPNEGSFFGKGAVNLTYFGNGDDLKGSAGSFGINNVGAVTGFQLLSSSGNLSGNVHIYEVNRT